MDSFNGSSVLSWFMGRGQSAGSMASTDILLHYISYKIDCDVSFCAYMPYLIMIKEKKKEGLCHQGVILFQTRLKVNIKLLSFNVKILSCLDCPLLISHCKPGVMLSNWQGHIPNVPHGHVHSVGIENQSFAVETWKLSMAAVTCTNAAYKTTLPTQSQIPHTTMRTRYFIFFLDEEVRKVVRKCSI